MGDDRVMHMHRALGPTPRALVKCTSAMSSGSVRAISKTSDAEASAALKSVVPAGGAPAQSVKMTCSSEASSFRQGSTLRQ